ncbi:response regulator [Aquimarina sp. RZ0]|uniref:response regulator n=1 Tax=Aquimarina sp. RZ0 TaxID=2607730 RepID=UPI0011F3299A|nr:response regulator [Aquimarina sp. RZ0]KAA1248097.1 response regulator [Aquimarina sp. RZ0]
MKKIECILLVDDSPSTNFYHKKLIETTGEVDQIFDVENGLEALDYIYQKGKYDFQPPRPNIIFLDINMPKMDGFEFLERYSKIPKALRADVLVVFLTTSNWVKDKLKAIESNLVYDFLEKPLKMEELKKVSDHYRTILLDPA